MPTSRTVGPSGVGRRKRTSKPAVMNGTGAPGARLPSSLRGFPHHHRGAVAVEHGRDDPAVHEPEAVVVLRPGRELRDHDVTLDVAAQVEAVGIGVAAPEARELRVQRLLDAAPLRHHAGMYLPPSTTST